MICSKDKCTGCFACYNICPKNAIQMKEDEYGNVYPEIIIEKCINCNLCKKICPSINKVNAVKSKEAFAAYNKDKNTRKNSTSGAAATTFCINILNENGVVYGACNLFDNSKFTFVRIDKIEDLYKIRGSKYVHCYIEDNFKKAKNDLDSGKGVLFIATPCQIAGLKNFLSKEYENLITIDIICHGVPGQKILFDNIRSYNIKKEDVKYISFRDDKGYNFKLYCFCNENSNDKKEILYKKCEKDYYYKNFLEGNIFRQNCYNCIYASPERCSDITIGDFWGLKSKSKKFSEPNKGISVILINSKKGKELLNKCKDEFIIEQREVAEAVDGNDQLRLPVKKNKKYKIFINKYPKYGYLKTMKKMRNFKEILKDNKTIYKIYKMFR